MTKPILLYWHKYTDHSVGKSLYVYLSVHIWMVKLPLFCYEVDIYVYVHIIHKSWLHWYTSMLIKNFWNNLLKLTKTEWILPPGPYNLLQFLKNTKINHIHTQDKEKRKTTLILRLNEATFLPSHFGSEELYQWHRQERLTLLSQAISGDRCGACHGSNSLINCSLYFSQFLLDYLLAITHTHG